MNNFLKNGEFNGFLEFKNLTNEFIRIQTWQFEFISKNVKNVIFQKLFFFMNFFKC